MVKRIFIDIDDTINFYSSYHAEIKKTSDTEYPQSIKGFFLHIPINQEAKRAVLELDADPRFDVWFATRPSYKNIHFYSERATWVKNHFGEEWLQKLILIPDKSLLIGDYLIDDVEWSEFKGEMLRYDNNWEKILKHIKRD